MIGNLNYGNIVAPNGASIIYGANTTSDNFDIGNTNEETYQPYTIVITDEELDETIRANQVQYEKRENSSIIGPTVQSALRQLEYLILSNIPTFTREIISISAANAADAENPPLTFTNEFFEETTMVYYNGILLGNDASKGINQYEIFNEEKKIRILFPMEENDIIMLVGLSAAQNSSIEPPDWLTLINEGVY